MGAESSVRGVMARREVPNEGLSHSVLPNQPDLAHVYHREEMAEAIMTAFDRYRNRLGGKPRTDLKTREK